MILVAVLMLSATAGLMVQIINNRGQHPSETGPTFRPGSARAMSVLEGGCVNMLVDDSNSLLYVADVSNGSVDVVDLYHAELLRNISVGTDPYGLAESKDHTQLYVGVRGTNQICVIDTASLSVSKTISLNETPWSLASGTSGWLYVTSTGTSDNPWQYPMVVDVNNGVQAGLITGAGVMYKCTDIVSSGDGTMLYMGWTGVSPTSIYKFVANGVNVTYLTNNYYDIGSNLEDMALTQNGSLLYLACGAPYYIPVISTSDWTLKAQLSTGPYPYSVCVAEEVGLAFAAYGYNNIMDVKVFDTATYAYVSTFSFGPPMNQIRASADGKIVYAITSPNDDLQAELYMPAHSPISVIGNGDFTAANGVIWGNGTTSNPYVVAHWYINASTANGISIQDTDAHFIVRSCCVYDGASNYHAGIRLLNCVNGTLEKNTCSNDYEGMSLESSSNNTLVNNNCSSNSADGIYLDASSDFNAIVSNRGLRNAYNGIDVVSSSNNTLVSNDWSSNGYDGAYIGYSANNNTLDSNNCSSNYRWGIQIRGSSGNVMLRNQLCNNLQYGMYIYDASSSNIVFNNTFIGNNGAGSTYNSSHVQACDDGTNNWWNSTDGYGNYWSDWTSPDVDMNGIVDVPYVLDGGSGAKDYYPLTTTPTQPIQSSG